MKIKINRNILWAETFVRELVSCGVKYASLSPGSRNTPLTLAFAGNKKIKSFVHIDERSSGFFALGLAKATNTPVAVVCTSGTATAELYPAIIEAYQQRVPLIVCTADRPPELRGRGANQTINQNNLYKNHIRWFYDAGLPEPSIESLAKLKEATKKAVNKSLTTARGPVHLNFPFKKPFEPISYTDEINKDTFRFVEISSGSNFQPVQKNGTNISKKVWVKEILDSVTEKEKGIIIAGPGNFDKNFAKECQALSVKLGYPVFADGVSQLRFGNHKKENIFSNYDAFLRSETFSKKLQPEIIIQFGRTITSKGLENFLNICNADRFMINEFGDWFDPSEKAKAAYACDPFLFCTTLNQLLEQNNFKRKKSEWTETIQTAEEKAANLKIGIIDKSAFPNECRIIEEILNNAPDGCNIMLSNSMPVRDFDYFASNKNKSISVFNNRGASGIDGITSTAFGISAANKKPTILLTGDLAFYYDLNSLLTAQKHKTSLTIVLVNNNGGGIFEILPISNYGKVFKEFFVTPHQLNFHDLVKAYGGNFYSIKSWQQFQKLFTQATAKKQLTVLEIQTKATQSLKLRRKFWKDVNQKLLKIQ
ncbi:MAG: 2-succinyl-5-enolpyruvyl-6-hydroxy-3-cyclohexene-1-carboxylic-acid synthase [Ignavibacteriaceae bacterium]